MATLWLQDAFADRAPASLVVWFGAAGRQLPPAPVPSFPPGAVLRWSLALEVPAEVDELWFALDSAQPEGSERVRAAWRLLDTYEIASESEMKPVFDNGADGAWAIGIGLGAIGSPVVVVPRTTSAGGGLVSSVRTKVHRAAELPPGLAFRISSASAAPVPLEPHELVWRPGQPLPSPRFSALGPVASAPASTTATTRRCPACGFRDDDREHERATSCPSCDAFW